MVNEQCNSQVSSSWTCIAASASMPSKILDLPLVDVTKDSSMISKDGGLISSRTLQVSILRTPA